MPGGMLFLAADTEPPTVQLSAPVYASDRSRDRAFYLRWRGRGDIARYRLEVRPNGIVVGRWRTVAITTRTRASFTGKPGITYVFRLRARDRTGNLSSYDYRRTSVPIDDRNPHVGRGPGWELVRHRPAWGGTLTRARRAGLELAVPFRGTRVALIASRSPRGGTLLVSLAGRLAAVSLRGHHRHRRVVFRSRRLAPGRHVLRIRTLDRGTADIDAIGVDKGPAPPLVRR